MVSYSGTLLFALITFFVAPSQLVTLSHSNIDYNELFRLTPRQCIHTIHQFFSIITKFYTSRSLNKLCQDKTPTSCQNEWKTHTCCFSGRKKPWFCSLDWKIKAFYKYLINPSLLLFHEVPCVNQTSRWTSGAGKLQRSFLIKQTKVDQIYFI